MPVRDARGQQPPSAVLAEAAGALRAGRVVGLPTDTVYGVAALPSVPGATEAIFRLKGRPSGTALPVLVSGVDQAGELGELGPAARRLADAFWPGGLTIVVRRQPGVSLDLGGDAATVGLRSPAHPVPLALCRRLGPVAATSANRHGEPPIGSAADLAATFPELLVLDAGVCDGAPSTVVDCTGDEVRLLRGGAVGWADISRAVAG